MYDIKQFRPTLYVLLILGVVGFSLAASVPGLGLLAVAGILLNWYLVTSGAFVPLPRMLAGAVTLLALAFVAWQFNRSSAPVLGVGQFLVLLQLVKLFEQRGNRDYGQLLVLSLLLMVAGAISTASLVFAVLLIAYLFVSLYCCLLFHLKVETDHARQALGLRQDQANPTTLRQDQRFLSSSMWRFALLLTGVALASAVVVFLVFPRNAGAGFLTPLQLKQRQAMTGISEEVSFQQIAKITQNTEAVARVWVWKNDQPVRGGVLMLRAVALDTYTGRQAGTAGRYRWVREATLADRAWNFDSRTTSLSEPGPQYVTQGQAVTLPPAASPAAFAPAATDRWRQKVMLEPSGTSFLFAMAGPFQFTPGNRSLSLRYIEDGELLQSIEPQTTMLEYEVVSHNELLRPDVTALPQPSTVPIDPAVRAYAQRPEVSGANARGGLAAQRPPGAAVHALDAEIAQAIETHLRTQFTYTLDLTDAARLSDEDPVAAFLTRFKRGHCEYFAGAMTLMCQSLGMRARVVVGFKCDEFNPYAGYFQVRQSHAHAWVEVLTTDGWRTFDPTSAREAAPAEQAGVWQRAKYFLDFLEFQWAKRVVAYDNNARDDFVGNLEAAAADAVNSAPRALRQWNEWLDFDPQSWVWRSYLIAGVIGLMAAGVLGAVGWFVWERWKLRRRAAHLGIEALPTTEQIRLARQLGFYDDLMRLLERHGIGRPRHLTLLEFSRTLSYLPADAYALVHRLTGVFYRVRYGRQALRSGQQRRLAETVARVASAMGTTKPPVTPGGPA